jgi:hypothetical protein
MNDLKSLPNIEDVCTIRNENFTVLELNIYLSTTVYSTFFVTTFVLRKTFV